MGQCLLDPGKAIMAGTGATPLCPVDMPGRRSIPLFSGCAVAGGVRASPVSLWGFPTSIGKGHQNAIDIRIMPALVRRQAADGKTRRAASAPMPEWRSFPGMKQIKAPKKRVLIISQYEMPDFKRNMNAYQRIYHGADHADVTLLLRKNHVASDEITKRVTVAHAPFVNRWLFLAYAIWFCLLLRLRGCRIILTEPSGFAAVGFCAKYLFSYFWVMDVWDRPRWRTGYHETSSKRLLSDRFVFWLMRNADLYLLSVLPRAAKDIDPPPERSIQYYNAINLDDMATDIPSRSANETFRVAYAKSEFSFTLGLDLLIKAAEILKEREVPVEIHIIGMVPDDSVAEIEASQAADLFIIRGFTSTSRTALFRTMHAGLVPYMPYEDLSYIFPIKVLEHLSQGNPVIVSRLPGLCALIEHEQNGMQFEPADPISLADAIARTPGQLRLLGNAGPKCASVRNAL